MLSSIAEILESQSIVWIIQTCIILFATIVINYVIKSFLNHLEVKLAYNKASWDDITLKAAKKPLRFLVWALSFSLIARVTSAHLGFHFPEHISLLKNFGIIFSISWFVWRLIAEYEIHLTKTAEVEPTTVVAITKLLRILVLIIVGLTSLETAGVSIAGIIAFGSIGGLSVGFASKDLLANFFGALVIFLDRPFLVGQTIRSPDRQIEGEVRYVSWRCTHIQTPDKKMLYVPNSLFSTIIIENMSRVSNRRISETISIRYKDIEKISKITAEIKQMLDKNDAIDHKQAVTVNLDKLEKYSLDLTLEAFTKTVEMPKYRDVKEKILLEITKIITTNGAEIALPTSVVNVEKGN